MATLLSRSLSPPRLLVCWLAALGMGLLLSSVVPSTASLLFYIVAVPGMVLAAIRTPSNRWSALLILSLPLLLLGFVRGRQASTPARDDAARFAGGPSLWVQGVIEGEPVLLPGRPGQTAVELTLHANAIDDFSTSRPASGRVRVVIADPGRTTLLPGDSLRVRGRLTLPDDVRNPDGFDARAFLARRGIGSTLTARRPADVEVLVGTPNDATALVRAAHWLRTRLLGTFAAHLPADDAALLGAVTISSRSGLPADIRDALARDGALYVLSTSGLHLSALAFVLAFGLRRLGVPVRPANALAIALLWLFVVASGGNAPALRAGITLTVLLGAPIVRRSPDALHSLAFAAFAILLLDPLALFDPGFQLSFATIATLLLYLPPLAAALLPWEPGQPRWKRVLLWGLEALLAGLVAQVGCVLLSAEYFHQVSLIAPFATALLGPLSVLVLFSGFASAGAAAILPAVLGGPVWAGMHALLGLLRCVAFAFGGLPGAAFSVASPPLALVWLYYLILGGSAPFVRRRFLEKSVFAAKGRVLGGPVGAPAARYGPGGTLPPP